MEEPLYGSKRAASMGKICSRDSLPPKTLKPCHSDHSDTNQSQIIVPMAPTDEQVNTLESTRLGLLEALNEANAPGSSHHIRTSGLKQEYNLVNEKLVLYQKGPLQDPLLVLPPELWIAILQFLKGIAEEECPASPTDQILILTLVSSVWRDAVFSTPSLWSCINLGEELDDEDGYAKFCTALHLSRHHPITLVVSMPMPPSIWAPDMLYDVLQMVSRPPSLWDRVLSVIRLHSHRVIEIRMNLAQSQSTAGDLSRILQKVDNLVHLHSIVDVCKQSVHRYEYGESQRPSEWVAICAKAPNIISIDGLGISNYEIQFLNQSIRNITTKMTIDHVLPHISRLHSLRSISTSQFLYSEHKSIAQQAFPKMPNLRNLKAFSSIGNYRISDNLSKIALIESLSLTFPSSQLDDLREFISLIDQLYRLVKLELNIWSSTSAFTPPPRNPVAATLRKLSIKTAVQDDTLHEKLYPTLSLCFPHVQELAIEARSLSGTLGDYIYSLEHLQQLHLSLTFRATGRLRSKQLLSLRAMLNYQGLSDRLLDTLECPELSRLDITAATPVELHASLFSALESLTFPIHWAIWEVTNLSSLRHVSLGEAGTEASGNLFVHLTLWPDHLPVLERISMDEIPEWDLLFLMLEKRNFLPNPGIVTPIQHLDLPWAPSYSLLHSLTRLVQGFFVQRPTNYDLSVAGLREIIHDKTILGCYKCLLTMHPCTKPLVRRFEPTGAGHKFEGETMKIMKSYPSTEEVEWIRGREERNSMWETCRIGAPARFESCDASFLRQRCMIVR